MAILATALVLTGCNAKPEQEVIEDVVVEQTQVEIEESSNVQEENEILPEETEAVVESKTISPLPVTIDMNQLDNCTVAVSFEEGDAYVDDNGAMQLDVTVYTYDLFDMVDMSLLEVGDIIVIRNQEVQVTSLERNDLGLVSINGGEENGGYDLFTNENGVYYETLFNDAKAYYPLGKATIRVSVDFEFYDNSDLEAGEKMYYPGDFLTDAGIQYDFRADNTTIVIEDGQIIAMNRSFTP